MLNCRPVWNRPVKIRFFPVKLVSWRQNDIITWYSIFYAWRIVWCRLLAISRRKPFYSSLRVSEQIIPLLNNPSDGNSCNIYLVFSFFSGFQLGYCHHTFNDLLYPYRKFNILYKTFRPISSRVLFYTQFRLSLNLSLLTDFRPNTIYW